MRSTVATLIAESPDAHGVHDTCSESERTVFCWLRSVGMRESYEAQSHGFRAEWTLVLSDYAEYRDEAKVLVEGRLYNVLRTYINDNHQIEITIGRREVAAS